MGAKRSKTTAARVYASRREYRQVDNELLREIGELYETPLAALALSVLRETVHDLRSNNFLVRSNAAAFVRSARFVRMLAALDLDVHTVRARFDALAAQNEIHRATK